MNIFDNSLKYRKSVIDINNLVKTDRDKYLGKSIVSVFFTRYCPVGCDFCFFKSPKKGSKSNTDQFDEKMTKKFIDFSNKANVGYLHISGGGEPTLKKKSVMSSIENVNTDHIVLVTSGYWARNPKGAEQYLDDIKESIGRNTKPKKSFNKSKSE